MGEIAEMMIDGTLCQYCGVVLKGKAEGYPRTCHSCRVEHSKAGNANAPGFKVKCPDCGKLVKRVGLDDHRKDAHGVKG